MWSNIEGLRGLSHLLMLIALSAAIVAAIATGARFYVDRRVSELSGQAQREAEQKRRNEFEAKLEQERAARKAAEAKAKQARGITSEQRIELLACLKAQSKEGGVFVRPAEFDAEATAYGKQVEQLLREAGFEIRKWPEASVSWSIPGAFLIVKDLNHAPRVAVVIQSCFEKVGIILEGHAKEGHPADAVSIAIGSR